MEKRWHMIGPNHYHSKLGREVGKALTLFECRRFALSKETVVIDEKVKKRQKVRDLTTDLMPT